MVLGVMALSFVLAPQPSAASETARPGSPTRIAAPACVQLRNATLVIPNGPASGSTTQAQGRRSAPGSIMYGTCDLSTTELRGLARAQFHAREAMRVK